jgi:hypothetical protein
MPSSSIRKGYEGRSKAEYLGDVRNRGDCGDWIRHGIDPLAVALNGTLGAYLIRAGRRRDSLILIANGKHVLTIAGRAWES